LTTTSGATLTTPHLWSLLITLDSNERPEVKFQGDPMLMSTLGLTDQNMDARILSALDTSVADQVTLKSQYLSSGLTLFDTMLSSKNDYSFGETIEASASAVPEPSSLALLTIGSAACAAGIAFGRYWSSRARLSC
jgi:hypothetical protein